ncbi:tyrosine-type recombinase/integrase [Massilia brevitalea]|uniref:tyrosine-type recombinase/integrase n=1 Tax=Massilia brevitalea TaxID=442526 RepID=UPI002738AB32|nr:integrase family protein [Massilia brevitalea]
MASEKIPFTKSALTTTVPPATGRTSISDEQTRGLVLYVQTSGARTFYVYRKIGGRPLRILLGRFSSALPETRDFPAGTDPLSVVGNSAELNIRMARKLADAVNASLDKGINPASNARQAREKHQNEMTLRQAFDKYFTDHLIAHEKRSAELMRDDFARYIGKVAPGQKKLRGKERQKSPGSIDWEDRKLSAISSADVRHMMICIKDNTGSRTANRAYVLLRSLYNKVIAWKLYSGENPCDGIDKFKEVSRDRYVTGDELPRFLAAIEKHEHQDFKDFILLSLFTAARRQNVLAMRWQDLNFHGGIWTVPGEFSKNGSALTIPITDYVREILERRKANCQVPFDRKRV